MKRSEIKEIQDYFQTDLFEMSNYSSDDTGLPSGMSIWVRSEPNGLPHTKYRIKISHPQKGSAVFALWGDEPKQLTGNREITGNDLKKISELIKLSHDSIIKHINGEISSLVLGKEFENHKKIINEL